MSWIARRESPEFGEIMRKAAVCAVLVWLAGAGVAQTPETASKPLAETWLWVRLANASLAWNLHAGRWSIDQTMVDGQWAMRWDEPQMIDGHPITWVQTKFRLSCPDGTAEKLYQEELDAGLRAIFEITDGEPYEIQPGTPDHYMNQLYCENKQFANVNEADGVINMINALSAAAPKPATP